ncbi:MAG: nicotinate-nucleotide adenylyltransferase [Parvibaculaceae bacterium]
MRQTSASGQNIFAGMTVGLLGGSFNPAHDGHLHVAHECLRTLKLDRIWLLVSPQNPLKPVNGMAPFATRYEQTRALVAARGDKRIAVSDFETQAGTSRTVDTLAALQQAYPHINFVWLMGSDNMRQFPRWASWRVIAASVPIAVYPRPGSALKARLSPAAQYLRAVTIEPSDAALLPRLVPPALVFLEGREHPASSTAIRDARVTKS